MQKVRKRLEEKEQEKSENEIKKLNCKFPQKLVLGVHFPDVFFWFGKNNEKIKCFFKKVKFKVSYIVRAKLELYKKPPI